MHAFRPSHVIMPYLIQRCFVLALHASVQSFFNFKRSRGQDTSVRGAPRSRVQHVQILSNSCILNRLIPTLLLVVNSYLNGKRFSMLNLGLRLGFC